MKNSYLYTGLVALLFASFYLVSCLNEDNKIPPNCYDGVLNQDEEAIDCGGVCERCDPCLNGIWDVLEGELCIDCGGDCPPCTECNNCVQDINEFGIDCGGVCDISCEELCDDGILNGNEDEVDCGGACEPCPTCIDGVMNGYEVGIDCGDPLLECPTCATDGNCTNTFIDGIEDALNCVSAVNGGGTTGYCPVCVNSFTWTEQGTFYNAENDLSAILDAGGDSTITITGTVDTGEILTFTMPRPVAGWVWGAEFFMNNNTSAGGLYQDAFGEPWATFAEPSGFTMIITTITPISGGVISGTFSGTMLDGTTPEPMTKNFTSGQFTLNID